MRFLRFSTALILILVLYATWPPSEEHINIVVSYMAESDAAGLDVLLGAGKDRTHFRSLQPGDRRRTLLLPDRAVTFAEERRLYMRYFPLDADIKSERWWEGPELPMDVSYRIAIEIHADGQVSYCYCIKPCKLPN